MIIEAELTLATPEYRAREVRVAAEYDWQNRAFVREGDISATCICCGQAIQMTKQETWTAETVLDEQARDYAAAEMEGAQQP